MSIEGKTFGAGGESRPTSRQIGVHGIATVGRLRLPDEIKVKALAASMKEVGLINPIIVRVDRQFGMGYSLIAGAHRLAAARKLGWEGIDAVVVEASDAEARLAEIDENLIRNELTPAERALHIAERKRVYEELHPETKNGAVGNGRKKVRQVGEATSDRFTADAAEKTGTSERAIQRDASRGAKISNLQNVVGTSLDKGEELDALAKLPISQQALLIERASRGEQVTARKATPKAESDDLSRIKRLWSGLTAAEKSEFLEWAGVA